MKRAGLFSLVLVCAPVVNGGAQSVARVAHVEGAGARIHARLLALADSGLSGGVLVERNESLLLEAGYGFANREKHIPFTSSTIGQIGSITKQFTATAIVDLAERGKLRYTDSLAQFFADVPAQARAITIGQLLSHTSGVPDNCGSDFLRITKAEIVHRCLAQPLLSAPGQKFAYSNLNFSVLAAVAEQVAGMPLERYLNERFFSPLGMTRTGYFFPGVSPDSFAIGYMKGEPRGNILTRILPLDSSFWNLKGNGGMQSTLDDMYRWYRALKAGPGLTDGMRSALFSPHAQRDSSVYFGYGWFLRLDSLGRTTQISHSGSDGVFVALWYWRPIDHVFIYTVTSFGQSDLASGLVAIIRKLLDVNQSLEMSSTRRAAWSPIASRSPPRLVAASRPRGGSSSRASTRAAIDAKYELEPGVTLDATANTDFAEADVDQVQVNLTRFGLFLPEKRDFFLENAGVFEFGTLGNSEPPPHLLFFSRRIGLSDSGQVPVLGGARLTGRKGAETFGLLHLQTAAAFDNPRMSSTVVLETGHRWRRILRRYAYGRTIKKQSSADRRGL
jgi:CubicO group peptidase (beta-lactamase class C family)